MPMGSKMQAIIRMGMRMVMMMNDLRPTIDIYSRAIISLSLLMVLVFYGVDKNVVHRR